MAYQHNRQSAGDPRHRSGRSGSGGPPPPKLPEPQKIVYFVNGQPDSTLMDDKAEEIAQQLALSGLGPTQLRRYYDDVMNLYYRVDADAKQRGGDRDTAFNALRADFKMLKAKAVYANGRSQKTFPKALLQFFIDHVHSVENADDFAVFCKHFQAVVAFHRFYKPKD